MHTCCGPVSAGSANTGAKYAPFEVIECVSARASTGSAEAICFERKFSDKMGKPSLFGYALVSGLRSQIGLYVHSSLSGASGRKVIFHRNYDMLTSTFFRLSGIAQQGSLISRVIQAWH